MSNRRPATGVSAMPSIEGWVDERFAAVRRILEQRADCRAGWAGAVAAYLDGRLIVDLWADPPYLEDSLQLVYSSTKGIASLCLALLIDRGELDPDQRVAHYWPEFAHAGKRELQVRELVSHQAGLLGPAGGFSLDEYIEHTALAERLAGTAPLWRPGTAHGYHALTWGTLVDELIRRVSGESTGSVFQRELQRPYELEFFLGLADSDEARLVRSANGGAFAEADWSEHERIALNITTSFPRLSELENLRAVRAAALPAVSGVGSARGIARAYAAAATGVDGGAPLLSPPTLAKIAEPQVCGPDQVLGFTTSFGLGFQTPSKRIPLLGPASFGHDGFAGSLGLASPRHGLSFGYMTNHIPEPAGGADPLTIELLRSLLAHSGSR